MKELTAQERDTLKIHFTRVLKDVDERIGALPKKPTLMETCLSDPGEKLRCQIPERDLWFIRHALAIAEKSHEPIA